MTIIGNASAHITITFIKDSVAKPFTIDRDRNGGGCMVRDENSAIVTENMTISKCICGKFDPSESSVCKVGVKESKKTVTSGW